MSVQNTPPSFRSGFTVRRDRGAVGTMIGLGVCLMSALAVTVLIVVVFSAGRS